MPHLSVDPIVIASHVVTALQTVLSREISPTQTAVLGFGSIHGGTVFNVVSDEVELKGTVRTLDDSVREFILRRTQEIAESVAKGFRGEAQFLHVKGAPVVFNDEAVARLVANVAAPIVGEENVLTISPPQAGDDITFFLREAPGCYFLVGCANAERGITASHHNPGFDYGRRRTGRSYSDPYRGGTALRELNLSSRLRKKGSPEGRSPFGGGSGGVPQIQFPPHKKWTGPVDFLGNRGERVAGYGKRGVQRGGAPLAGVWGCPPDTISTPSWPGRGQADARKGFFSNLSRLRRWLFHS